MNTQTQQPSIGRIVLYALSSQDVDQIRRRRTTSESIRERLDLREWPAGAQAHMGNSVGDGQLVPAMIVAVWGPACVNLRCILDGTDEFWATSRNLYTQPSEDAPATPPQGMWIWPPRV